MGQRIQIKVIKSISINQENHFIKYQIWHSHWGGYSLKHLLEFASIGLKELAKDYSDNVAYINKNIDEFNEQNSSDNELKSLEKYLFQIKEELNSSIALKIMDNKSNLIKHGKALADIPPAEIVKICDNNDGGIIARLDYNLTYDKQTPNKFYTIEHKRLLTLEFFNPQGELISLNELLNIWNKKEQAQTFLDIFKYLKEQGILKAEIV